MLIPHSGHHVRECDTSFGCRRHATGRPEDGQLHAVRTVAGDGPRAAASDCRADAKDRPSRQSAEAQVLALRRSGGAARPQVDARPAALRLAATVADNGDDGQTAVTVNARFVEVGKVLTDAADGEWEFRRGPDRQHRNRAGVCTHLQMNI